MEESMEWWKKIVLEIADDFLSVRTLITLGCFGVFYYEVVRNPALATNTDLKTLMGMLLTYWFATRGSATAKQSDSALNGSAPKVVVPPEPVLPVIEPVLVPASVVVEPKA